MNELIKQQQLPINEIMSMGKAFQESGMFPDIKSAAQAIVKIQAGQEIGITPFAAMTGIHIIQGRPTIGAGLIASKVKSSVKYDYKVKEMTEKACILEFYEGKELIGVSSFTLEDAKKAQTKNLDKFPKNMLFARAISNGVKWFCPDIFNGPVYTPEEFGEVPEKTDDVSHEVISTPAAEVIPEPEITIGDNERDELFALLGTSTYEQKVKDKLFNKINSYHTREQYQEAKKNLLANQLGYEGMHNPGQKAINKQVAKKANAYA
jgi:hypothetical protein